MHGDGALSYDAENWRLTFSALERLRHNPPPLAAPARPIPRTSTARDAPLSIFRRFLKFGALAWGGPAAQIAMIKDECVDEEEWVSEDSFKKTLAVFQILPGPEAHELCVYFRRFAAAS